MEVKYSQLASEDGQVKREVKCFKIGATTLLVLGLIGVILRVTFLAIYSQKTTYEYYDNINAMSFNIEYGAEKYSRLSISNILKLYQIDIALFQEVFTEKGVNAAAIVASIMNWNYLSFNRSQTAILSKWKMTPIAEFDHYAVVLVNTTSEKIPNFYAYVVHLDDWYYQPFQAANLPYCRGTVCQPNSNDPDMLIKYANDARGNDTDSILSTLDKFTDLNVILGGDFNEPSYRDWSEFNKQRGFCPVAVNFPTVKRLEEKMVDTYRYFNPSEAKDSGITWPDYYPGYAYRSDRIDYLFVNKETEIGSTLIVSGIGSDHKAVAVDVRFLKTNELNK